MDREQRIKNARHTLETVKMGVYATNGREVNIEDAIRRSISNTLLYSPEELSVISERIEKKTVAGQKTVITLTNQTTMEAMSAIAAVSHTGCLNFASAKNPGGGFLTGALAQEECLASASSLYPSLLKCMEMYEYNRSRKTCLYSDYMIYSPGVVFFKDDNGCLLENPYQADVLTSPAVNIAAIKQNNPAELTRVEQTMLTRIDKMLAVFAMHNVETLVLGAWGCGVFQNNSNDIARYFAHFLTGNGKYTGCFLKVIFAVFDRSKSRENFNAFSDVFSKA
jgi:uncharacterized protein (TIGR02452 family)